MAEKVPFLDGEKVEWIDKGNRRVGTVIDGSFNILSRTYDYFVKDGDGRFYKVNERDLKRYDKKEAK